MILPASAAWMNSSADPMGSCQYLFFFGSCCHYYAKRSHYAFFYACLLLQPDVECARIFYTIF